MEFRSGMSGERRLHNMIRKLKDELHDHIEAIESVGLLRRLLCLMKAITGDED